jgi:hypothetical protein
MHSHPFSDMRNLGGLSHHYLATQGGGYGVDPAGFTGGQHWMQGGMGGTQRPAEQMTGKRGSGCDNDEIFAKRARTDLVRAPGADVCLEDAQWSRASTDANGYWYMADSCQAGAPPAPQPEAAGSVYEEYCRREAMLASARQTGTASDDFRCPSGWSGTEWDVCPVPFATAQNSMECDVHNISQDHSLYNASLYGDLLPRGC